MIPIVNWTEDAREFPNQSIEMRLADSENVRQRIREVLDAEEVQYCGRGFNCAHHLAAGGTLHEKVVVRRMLAPVPALERRLEREYSVLVALRRAGFPNAPTPVRRLMPGDTDGSPAFVMTYVPGPSLPMEPDALREFGRVVKRLHSVEIPVSMRALYVTPEEAVRRAFMRVCSNLDSVRSAMAPDDWLAASDLRRRLERNLPRLEWKAKPPVLVHGDLGDHNVIFSNLTPVLMDWEFACPAEPIFDLMWLFSGRAGFAADEQEHVLEGYGGMPRGREQHLPWLRRLALLDMGLWAQSGLADIEVGRNAAFFGPKDRAFLEGQVARLHWEA